jgi:hypothetical protein
MQVYGSRSIPFGNNMAFISNFSMQYCRLWFLRNVIDVKRLQECVHVNATVEVSKNLRGESLSPPTTRDKCR